MLNLSMSDKLNTRVIQVTNIAPSCSKDQLRTLFGYLGRIKELEMFPPDGAEGVVTARVAYIEFEDSMTTGVALHLSSTVFIDRAIMIVPVMDGKIPDESSALNLTPSAVAGMLPGQPTWPANVVSQVTGLGANQIIMTNDPRLTSLGLPQYPPLPATTDPSKIEEIRRTVYLSDLDPKVTPEMLLSFFSQTGEIKYIRMAGDENGSTRSAYIEFTDQRCIAQALSYNNVVFQGRTVSVKHATTSIMKPTPRSEASQREIDDAMKKVKEASKLISAAANSDRDGSISPTRKRSKSKGRSRSHSKSRRSRSRSRGRRRRSISKPRRRSRSRRRSPRRSRSPVRRRRSRSRGRVPPPAPPVSRDRRRSRTRSPVRRRRSRSRSKSRGRVPPPAPPVTRKSRTPPKSYSRGRRSRSRSRRSRSRDRKEKVKERKKSRSMSPPTLIREGSATVGDERDTSPAKGNERSPSPPKARKRSLTPKKRSKSKSPSRRKKGRHSRSTSRKRSRSRSGSRHRSRKDRKRSRSRDRKHDSSKKKSSRDKDDKKKEGSSSSSSKIKRDYDEEEKGFASEGSDDRDNNSEGDGSADSPTEQPPVLEKDTDHQTVDMDMSD